jgi:hypothetical protein
MPRLRRAITISLILLFSLPALRAGAQAQGAAVLTTPLEGGIISGVVAIGGTAAHPQFQRYELAFGYDPNPTDSWFSIQPPATTPVSNDLLGRWDTAGVTDGTYVLRLRVFWSESDYLETFVRRVEVRNTPAETPTAGPGAVPLGTALPASVATAPTVDSSAGPLIALPPTATRPAPSGSGGGPPAANPATGFQAATLQRAFATGIGLTLLAFGLLGAYAGWRRYRRAHPRR